MTQCSVLVQEPHHGIARKLVDVVLIGRISLRSLGLLCSSGRAPQEHSYVSPRWRVTPRLEAESTTAVAVGRKAPV
jgi:hypothetical protein